VTYFVRRGQIAIAWAHCDPAGIVFNGRFFEFFDHSTWLMFEEVLATKPHEIRARFDIIGFPVVDVRVRFFKPLTYGVVVSEFKFRCPASTVGRPGARGRGR